jgi:hypothetical protein
MILGRREFLVGALGAGAVGGVALQTRAPVALSETSINPLSLGAAGNGTTDDLRALNAAIARAAQTGLPIDGGDAVFGIRGSLRVRGLATPWIRSLSVRQLALAKDLSTVHFERCERIRIDRLQIDIGTSRRVGYMNTTFGLWIEGGTGHTARNVEVFGHGKTSMVAIWNTSGSVYEDMTVKSSEFDDPSVNDDVVQGIWMFANADCILRRPTVADLKGNASYRGKRFANLRTRGISLSNNDRVSIIEPTVRNVDQGIDISGSDGNRQCVVEGGSTTDCGSVGVKLANSAVGCTVVRHTAERCGMYGFLASGPSDPRLPYKTSDCDFIDCTSIDPGYNRIAFAEPSGFMVRREEFDRDYPKGIRFIRCHAIDRQQVKTMRFGFFSDVEGQPGAKPNRLVDCTSVGHTDQARAGTWS